MERDKYIKQMWYALGGLLYCYLVYRFNSYLYKFSDIPDADEFHSLVTAIGKEAYPFAPVYVTVLKLLGLFQKDFFLLFKFNFLLIHFLFPLSFFYYNLKNKINLTTNIFFTTLFILSPLNLVITRKLHFWAMFILVSTFIVGRSCSSVQRKILIGFSFFVLIFFRIEFLLLFIVHLIKNTYRTSLKYYAIIFSIIVCACCLYFLVMPNMGVVALLKGTVVQGGQDSILPLVFGKNTLIYSALVIFAVVNSLYTHKIILAALIVFLLFGAKSILRKIEISENLREELSYLLILPLPILCLRNYYYYALPFHLIFYLLIVIIFNLTEQKIKSKIVFLFSGLSLILTPSNPNTSYFNNYPFFIAKGQDHLFFYNYLKRLPLRTKEHEYTILTNQEFYPILDRGDIKYYNPWFQEQNFCKVNNIIPDIVFLPNTVVTHKYYNEKGVVFTKCIELFKGKFKLVNQLERNAIWARGK